MNTRRIECLTRGFQNGKFYMKGLFVILLAVSWNSYSQQRVQPTAKSSVVIPPNVSTGKSYYGSQPNHAPRAIQFADGKVTSNNFFDNIHEYFGIAKDLSFSQTESSTDNIGMTHRYLQQMYKGIPVEGLGYWIHERNGFITSANGKAVRSLALDVNGFISEVEAFQRAVNFLQTKDTVFRSPRKLIVSRDFVYTSESFSVAFQFDIDVSFMERWRISIDARTGEVVNKMSLVNICLDGTGNPDEVPPLPYTKGTGASSYYGNRTIQIEQLSNNYYRMTGQTDHGGKIGTYDFRYRNPRILQLGFEVVKDQFISADTTFLSSYHEPAVAVHWGAEQVYDYFFNRFNRNSFDNFGSEISSYVHVGSGYNNAFWNGRVLAFGDGSSNNPVVELDVVSHEFTHGVTQYEARLTYSYESGALNESFSDIFGKAVEFSIFGDTATWQIGKYFKPGGIRDMSNPNLKEHPDTYSGDFWYTGHEDYGGVHYNSGVQNFWFYLLSEGGSGVNDHGHNYSIEPIGMEKAAQIAYRNLTEYLSSSSDYLDSRIGSLLATADLYGKNSAEYREVDEAWDAVGVIDEPIIINFEVSDITGTTARIQGSLQPRGDTVTYHFEYGTTLAYGSTSPVYEYEDVVDGLVTNLQSETKYYLRLVATNENGSSYSQPVEFTTLSLAPLVILKHTIDVTENGAILHGRINPNSLPTSYYFEYGKTPTFELTTPVGLLPDTTQFLSISIPIADLESHQTYYYRLVAANDFETVSSETASFITATKPEIHSIYPVVAAVGDEITITGKNFNSIPEKNHVRFGATRGVVLASTATGLKVSVPAGASFGPVTVQDIETGLLAESVQEFVPTYSGEFEKGNIQLRVAFNDTGYGQTLVEDMDGDGRPDLFTTHNTGFTIFQNVNNGGDITMESFFQSNFPTDPSFQFLTLVDLDGNGFKDVVGRYGDGLRVYPNKSVPGYVFFDIPVDLPIGYLRSIEFKDFDNDGHIDILGVGQQMPDNTTLITIFRNENPKNLFLAGNFIKSYELPVLVYIDYLISLDINNDQTPDLIVSTFEGDEFSVFTNTGLPGNFGFNENILTDTTRTRGGIYIGHDLNDDGWKDLISRSRYSNDEVSLKVFEHSGISAPITFSQPVVALDGHVETVQPGDIDGDGTVDLIAGDYDGKFFLVRNSVNSGEKFSDSSFTIIEQYGINENNSEVRSRVIVNDLNGDGRPEIINSLGYNFYPYKGNQIEIWQNDDASTCLDASSIRLEVSRYSATILLPPDTSIDQYEIECSYFGTTNWWDISSTTVGGLQSGRSYTLRIRTRCYLGFSAYEYIDFTTECIDLSGFSVNNIKSNQVTLYSPNIGSMEIGYSVSGEDHWVDLPQYTTLITNLSPGTTYDLRYRGRCSTPASYHYTSFITECPELSNLTISEITYNRAVVNWTSQHTGGDVILEYSTDNLEWLPIDETQILTSLIPGQLYYVRGGLKCTDTNSTFITRLFRTACPRVSDINLGTIGPFGTTVTWEDESATGSYSFIYSMTAGGEPIVANTGEMNYLLENLLPGTQYQISIAPSCQGEMEFTTIYFTTVCYSPRSIVVDELTNTSASLSWIDDFGGYPYFVDYTIIGSNKWITKEVTETNIILNDLRPGTRYEARVHISCTNETEPYASIKFETGLYGETTFAPNPTENIITIYPSRNLIGNNFELVDNIGRQVATGRLLDYIIDLSGFPAGMYYLKIDGELPMKIVKN